MSCLKPKVLESKGEESSAKKWLHDSYRCRTGTRPRETPKQDRLCLSRSNQVLLYVCVVMKALFQASGIPYIVVRRF